jgi:hypothetical protein
VASIACVPDQLPDATQVSVLVEVHLSVALVSELPDVMLETFEVKVSVGAGFLGVDVEMVWLIGVLVAFGATGITGPIEPIGATGVLGVVSVVEPLLLESSVPVLVFSSTLPLSSSPPPSLDTTPESDDETEDGVVVTDDDPDESEELLPSTVEVSIGVTLPEVLTPVLSVATPALVSACKLE